MEEGRSTIKKTPAPSLAGAMGGIQHGSCWSLYRASLLGLIEPVREWVEAEGRDPPHHPSLCCRTPIVFSVGGGGGLGTQHTASSGPSLLFV